MVKPWRRSVIVGLAGAVAASLVLWLCDPLFVVYWDGDNDLQVEFVVTDAHTGKPVRAASVDIRAERGSFCQDQEEKQFTLRVDHHGKVRHVCPGCMCFGSKSLLTNTFGSYVPKWNYQVTAKGYHPSQTRTLLEVQDQVRRTAVGKAELIVAVTLSRAEP